jgi:hypothetical protein
MYMRRLVGVLEMFFSFAKQALHSTLKERDHSSPSHPTQHTKIECAY